jgi:hypothetical protein
MTQDLSASTLEAVRKSMTVMSFMIIIFFLAGGHIPASGVAIKLPLSNVVFDKPERLLYALWVLMAWWVYRYFVLDALADFKEGFSIDLAATLMRVNGELKNDVHRYILNSDKLQDGYTIRYNKKSAYGDIVIGNSSGGYVHEIKLKSKVRPFDYFSTVTRGGSAVTFSLPLLMISSAFILTLISQA